MCCLLNWIIKFYCLSLDIVVMHQSRMYKGVGEGMFAPRNCVVITTLDFYKLLGLDFVCSVGFVQTSIWI